jgi:hypothetical protein
MAWRTRKFLVLGGAMLTLSWGSLGCPSDDGEEMNVLPTAGADSGDSGSADGTPTTTDPTGVDDSSGGGMVEFPQTYRFDCIDIRVVGDGDGDGEADGTAFQANVLQNAWSNDIAGFKLNILLTVNERDDAGGTAMVTVGSGVGTSAADMCVEATTANGVTYQAGYAAGTGEWGGAGPDTCSEASTDAAGGTYTFGLTTNDVIYVYAEDDDGTTFNCNPTGAFPNAVPIRAVEAVVTVASDAGPGYGELTGCLTEAEAGQLCSCLGACLGDTAHPDCGGCPNGSTPLASLLSGVGPSNRCTDLMGESAFDLTIGFSVSSVPTEPVLCG